ncbi:M23 family metallopeptidase, partial [Kocuria rhizosphaericola]|uniref:M23 family metallopeptidase n=1 Tax=Kocuria rhizosphaericola TaxID=3376284 RepID=UPI0037A0F720
MKFSLMQIGSPWAQGTPLVSHLAPGADPPVYKGKLPVNTLIAPARPPDAVHPAGQFGWRIAPDLGRGELHNGTDIGAPRGSPVVAAMDGVVRAVFWNEWGGKRVEVSHVGDLLTTYNHLDDIHVKKGDPLKASQQLGTVGMTGSRVTGPHLHFETWVDDETVDPQSFDWIDQGRVIKAPREAGQEVQRIPSGGPGDETSLDESEDCPYPEDHDIECSAPDAVDLEERCSTGGDDSDCPDEGREVQCPEGGLGTPGCPTSEPERDPCPEGGLGTPGCPTSEPERDPCPEGG